MAPQLLAGSWVPTAVELTGWSPLRETFVTDMTDEVEDDAGAGRSPLCLTSLRTLMGECVTFPFAPTLFGRKFMRGAADEAPAGRVAPCCEGGLDSQ